MSLSNIFIVHTLSLFFSRLVLDFDLLVFAFGQLPLVVCTWLCMFVSVLVVPYSLFHLWASRYQTCSHPALWSGLLGSGFMLYQGLGLGFLPTSVVLRNGLPPASRFIIIMEQVIIIIIIERERVGEREMRERWRERD